MPKRAADDGEEIAAAKKKAKRDGEAGESTPDGLKKDEEGNFYLDLGGLKRASVTVFKGKALMNIREYYTDKGSGDIKPGKKGITLSPSQWATLSSGIAVLTEKLEAVSNAGGAEEPSKSKKSAAEKPAKAKKSEKPAKKKKKEESEVEADDDD